MIIETLFVLALALETSENPQINITQCAPEEVCYPIDPQDPKVVVPTNCVLDQEGGLVCNPIDESEKWK